MDSRRANPSSKTAVLRQPELWNERDAPEWVESKTNMTELVQAELCVDKAGSRRARFNTSNGNPNQPMLKIENASSECAGLRKDKSKLG